MRDIRVVIDEIRTHVPRDERPLLYVLEDIYNAAAYNAPETQHFNWDALQRVLVDKIGGQPTLDWHFEVLSIFTTKSTGDIKRIATELNE